LIQLHPSSLGIHHAIEDDDGEEVRTELRQLIDRQTSFRWKARANSKWHDNLALLLALDQAQTAESPEAYAVGAFKLGLRKLATRAIASAAQWTYLHSPKALNLGTL